jgi:periplasmic divalent cation tolerance protein
MSMLIIHCTCADPESAAAIARSLVEERLAACVSQLPGVRSTYRWQGQVECADEVLLLIKSTRERYPALAARLRELHSYELPEIIAVDVSVADPAYQAWVESQVKPD